MLNVGLLHTGCSKQAFDTEDCQTDINHFVPSLQSRYINRRKAG